MYHPRLYGEFHEMGLKYGVLLYKNGFKLPEINKAKMEFGLQSYEELKIFYPEVVEEIRGFAQGIQERDEALGAFLLSLGALENTAQCSVFAFKNDNSMVIGRNYDMLFQFKKFTESSLIAPKDKFSYISQSDVFIGRSDGINEKGLFVGMSFVNGTMTRPGIGFHFILRKVLENCRTVAEAAEVIKNAHVSAANNFLLADRSGDMAVVESAVDHWNIRRPVKGENFVYITNQFMTEKMRPHDKGGVAWSKSKERYEGLADNLRSQGNLDLGRAKAILSDPCVCLDLKKEKFGTIWSVVADLSNLRIERAEGKPKVTNYKPETRLDWWLAKRRSS